MVLNPIEHLRHSYRLCALEIPERSYCSMLGLSSLSLSQVSTIGFRECRRFIHQYRVAASVARRVNPTVPTPRAEKARCVLHTESCCQNTHRRGAVRDCRRAVSRKTGVFDCLNPAWCRPILVSWFEEIISIGVRTPQQLAKNVLASILTLLGCGYAVCPFGPQFSRKCDLEPNFSSAIPGW